MSTKKQGRRRTIRRRFQRAARYATLAAQKTNPIDLIAPRGGMGRFLASAGSELRSLTFPSKENFKRLKSVRELRKQEKKKSFSARQKRLESFYARRIAQRRRELKALNNLRFAEKEHSLRKAINEQASRRLRSQKPSKAELANRQRLKELTKKIHDQNNKRAELKRSIQTYKNRASRVAGITKRTKEAQENRENYRYQKWRKQALPKRRAALTKFGLARAGLIAGGGYLTRKAMDKTFPKELKPSTGRRKTTPGTIAEELSTEARIPVNVSRKIGRKVDEKLHINRGPGRPKKRLKRIGQRVRKLIGPRKVRGPQTTAERQRAAKLAWRTRRQRYGRKGSARISRRGHQS